MQRETQTPLLGQPEQGAEREHAAPALPQTPAQQPGAQQHQGDIQRQDVQQRRVVDQQGGSDHSGRGIDEEEFEQAGDAALPVVHAEPGD